VSEVWKFPESWSKDGRFLSYTQSEPGKSRDIWILPMTGEARPFPFIQSPADEWGSAFSPDGRFLAYVSDESGRPEVFVRTFPSSPAKWQLSAGGGLLPIWRGDGKELFYLTTDGRVVAVPIASTPGGVEPGPARTLFQSSSLRLPRAAFVSPFAATRDGQRFLANLLVGQAESSAIVIQIGDKK
jgi:Tol biopolymer transport system component